MEVPRWVALAVAAGVTVAAHAHRVGPEQVIAWLADPVRREAFAIRDVRRDPALPRLLLVRVTARWHTVPAAERVEAAEHWRHLWRDGVAGGIVAVLDAESDAPVVNFDARGRARLVAAPP